MNASLLLQMHVFDLFLLCVFFSDPLLPPPSTFKDPCDELGPPQFQGQQLNLFQPHLHPFHYILLPLLPLHKATTLLDFMLFINLLWVFVSVITEYVTFDYIYV